MLKRFAAHIIVFILMILYIILVSLQNQHPNDVNLGYACLIVLMLIIGILLFRFIKNEYLINKAYKKLKENEKKEK